MLSTYQKIFEPGSSDFDENWAKGKWRLVRENYFNCFLFRSTVLQTSVTPDKWLQVEHDKYSYRDLWMWQSLCRLSSELDRR